MAESEFRTEVTQSLDRAFAEGHSVDNAAVELKTLRMASNVPLSRVREAVVAAIVDQIKIVEAGVPQRQEIASIITRWGPLIDKIGGVDAVETITSLQVNRKIPIHVWSTINMFLADSLLVASDSLRVIGTHALVRPNLGRAIPR